MRCTPYPLNITRLQKITNYEICVGTISAIGGTTGTIRGNRNFPDFPTIAHNPPGFPDASAQFLHEK